MSRREIDLTEKSWELEARCDFGLVGWLERTRIRLPLAAVEAEFTVSGPVALVHLRQVFHQTHVRSLDCVYSFPLPAGAAVFGCTMKVGDRLLRAKLQEEEEAKQTFEAQKRAGHRAGLVTAERPNLFTLQLGNVASGDRILVELSYFQLVDAAARRRWLRIPFCPGIRYLPGQPLDRPNRGLGVDDDTDRVADASRISPPRIGADHPDAALVWVHGVFEEPSERLPELSSPSHRVVLREREGRTEVTLECRGEAPDRDFVLVWQNQGTRVPRGWSYRSGEAAFALVDLEGPVLSPGRAPEPAELYFLIDRSGSMSGIKWEKACDAFLTFLDRLAPGDRVWASFFAGGCTDLSRGLVSAGRLRQDARVRGIARIGAGGGTDLKNGLEHALEVIRKTSAGGRPTLILVTDGQVADEEEILRVLEAAPDLVVHAFGIDTTVNDGLLRAIARHRGSCTLLDPQDDIVGVVGELATRLPRPSASGLRADPWEAAGFGLPDLYPGEAALVSLRGDPSAGSLSFEGNLPSGKRVRWDIPLAPSANRALELLWVKRRIDVLQERGREGEAVALALSHGLLSQGTAFVVWDPEVEVPVASQLLYQPSLEPAQWSASPGPERVVAAFRTMDSFPGPISAPPPQFSRRAEAPKEATVLYSFDSEGPESPMAPWESRCPGPQERSLLRRFRRSLEAETAFASAEARELLDLLCDWTVAEPERFALRLSELIALAKEALRSAGGAAPRSLAIAFAALAGEEGEAGRAALALAEALGRGEGRTER